MDVWAALGAGLIAGLAIAVPLGAIGVLLVREGATRGFAGGAAAAAAVASVDTLYCLIAVTAGAALSPLIAAWEPWPQIIGGAVLLVIAVRGLRQLRVTPSESEAASTGEGGSSWRRYALFFALTAVNPATVVYFAAIMAGLSAVAASAATAAAFVVGVAVASVGWQLLLVLAGAALRWKTGGRHRRVTTAIGSAVVGVLGVVMMTGAIF